VTKFVKSRPYYPKIKTINKLSYFVREDTICEKQFVLKEIREITIDHFIEILKQIEENYVRIVDLQTDEKLDDMCDCNKWIEKAKALPIGQLEDITENLPIGQIEKVEDLPIELNKITELILSKLVSTKPFFISHNFLETEHEGAIVKIIDFISCAIKKIQSLKMENLKSGIYDRQKLIKVLSSNETDEIMLIPIRNVTSPK
jgi:hypothetical protein